MGTLSLQFVDFLNQTVVFGYFFGIILRNFLKRSKVSLTHLSVLLKFSCQKSVFFKKALSLILNQSDFHFQLLYFSTLESRFLPTFFSPEIWLFPTTFCFFSFEHSNVSLLFSNDFFNSMGLYVTVLSGAKGIDVFKTFLRRPLLGVRGGKLIDD